MIRLSQKSLTLEEFLQYPETQPASEYKQGRVTQKPMPQGQHSTLQVDLTETINAATKRQKIARAYTEIRCIVGDRVIVPDIGIFTWDRIPTDEQGNVANQFNLAPNWLIEILSPNQATIPVIEKILHSLNYGTEMGWLIKNSLWKPPPRTAGGGGNKRQPAGFNTPLTDHLCGQLTKMPVAR